MLRVGGGGGTAGGSNCARRATLPGSPNKNGAGLKLLRGAQIAECSSAGGAASPLRNVRIGAATRTVGGSRPFARIATQSGPNGARPHGSATQQQSPMATPGAGQARPRRVACNVSGMPRSRIGRYATTLHGTNANITPGWWKRIGSPAASGRGGQRNGCVRSASPTLNCTGMIPRTGSNRRPSTAVVMPAGLSLSALEHGLGMSRTRKRETPSACGARSECSVGPMARRPRRRSRD